MEKIMLICPSTGFDSHLAALVQELFPECEVSIFCESAYRKTKGQHMVRGEKALNPESDCPVSWGSCHPNIKRGQKRI